MVRQHVAPFIADRAPTSTGVIGTVSLGPCDQALVRASAIGLDTAVDVEIADH